MSASRRGTQDGVADTRPATSRDPQPEVGSSDAAAPPSGMHGA